MLYYLTKQLLYYYSEIRKYIFPLAIQNNLHHHDIHYKHNGVSYVVRARKRRGPCPFTHVFTDQKHEITEQIKVFCGPTYNFHGVSTTPQLLGYNSLTFRMRNGDEKEFLFNDEIKL